MVPKPKVEPSIAKWKKPASSDEKSNHAESSSTNVIAPENIPKVNGGMNMINLTLAEEVHQFLKTSKTSSEEDLMAFMIPAAERRVSAGKGINAPMEPLGNAAKPLSLHPLTLESALSGLLKVKPPAKA